MDILLTSANYVRAVTSVSDNLDGNYLLPAIWEAQELRLRSVLGDCLLDRLKEIVAADAQEDPENAAYKALLDKCQRLLAYTTVVEVIPKVSWKVGNFGLSRSTDENLREASGDEIDKAMQAWQDKADVWCKEVQRFCIENAAAFPELRACDCDRMRANLYSVASCGWWLGGARGKIVRRG